MTLTPIRSLEASRKKFLWTRRTSCLESGNQTFLGSGGRNDSNTHQFARIGEKKLFMNSRYIMSRKWESNVFRLMRPKWLSHPSVRSNPREKTFLNSRYMVPRKWESNVFGLRRPKWFWHISARSNRREKNFLWTRRTSCLERWNQTFLGSGNRNDSNTCQFARISEKKIFYELDVHNV